MRIQSSSDRRKKDRREHARLPIADGLSEPINIEMPGDSGGAAHSMPAILTNLSAGGMSLILFSQPPQCSELQLRFQIPGLDRCEVTAKILRCHTKGEVHSLGLSFIKISAKDQKQILQMALDFNDCETRIALALPEACVPKCKYSGLCSKPQKSAEWPPRA